ncbi:MAG: hypothetical protein R3E79_10870 [Caldilineaceae bacterium]
MPISQTEISAACVAMAEAIYNQLHAKLYPPLKQKVDAARKKIAEADLEKDQKEKALQAWQQPDPLQEAEQSWRDLSGAIATGIVQYITDNMKITGIHTAGNINATVNGNTEKANLPQGGEHYHALALTAVQQDVAFVQSDDGTGHIAWKLAEPHP